MTKRFPQGRTLFKDVSLSFFHGAKVGILGANGSGKDHRLKILAGLDPSIDGTTKTFPASAWATWRRSPSWTPARPWRRKTFEGIGYRQQLLQRFDAISAAFGEEDADIDKLTAEQAEVQAEIEKLNCWDLSFKVDVAMAALNCPPRGIHPWPTCLA